MMQVDVPITFTTSPSLAPAPIASQWASRAPTGIGMPERRPSFAAQSDDRPPAIWSDAACSLSNFARMPAKRGSTLARNVSGGSPPRAAFHIHLWPIAQMLRFTFLGSDTPQRVAATISQCSNALAKLSRLSGLYLNQCSSLENPHSDE